MKSTFCKTAIVLAAILVCAAVCLVAMWAMLPHDTALAYDSYYLEDSARWDEGTFTELNYGIYWYDNESEIPKKYTNPNANFDPSKPTFLFTHGMKQGEGYHSRDLLSLCGYTDAQFEAAGYLTYEEETGYNVQFYQRLLQEGYNVGQFYWSQIAEESIDGDVKIWCSQTDMGERYTVSNANGDPRIQYADAPTTSVAVLYGESIKEALGADYNQILRIAGHSMGGQLSLATAQYLVLQQQSGALGNAHLVPERVSLLDPYLSMTPFDDEGLVVDSTGYAIPEGSYTIDLVAKAMDDITAYGVAVDVYCGIEFVYRLYGMTAKGVNATEADRLWCEDITERLTRNAAWTYLADLGAKFAVNSHTMIIDYYYTGMYETPAQDNWGRTLPSVFCSTQQVLDCRGMGFLQSVADSTKNPFYQRYSTFVRCDAYYNPTRATVTGTAPAGATATAYRGDTTYDVTMQGDQFTFDVQQAGVYTVRFTAADGTHTYAAFAVDAPDSVRALTLIEGAAQGAAKAVLVDAEGQEVQAADVVDDAFSVGVQAAGTYGVRLCNAQDEVLATNWYVVAEDKSVSRVALIEGTNANGQVSKISLVDATGKEVQTAEAREGTYRFYVADAGTYTVQFSDAEGKNVESREYAVGADLGVTIVNTGALKAGQIFLIVLLSVVGAALIVVAVVFTLKGRKKKNKKKDKPDYSR